MNPNAPATNPESPAADASAVTAATKLEGMSTLTEAQRLEAFILGTTGESEELLSIRQGEGAMEEKAKACARTPTQRRIRLPEHVVEAIRSIQTADSIYGLTPWKTEEMIRRGSEWIRQYVTEGQHTWYWFRKLAGSIRYMDEDTKGAGALLGHAPGSWVTADTYIKHLGSVAAIGPEELHPDRIRR